MSFRPPLTKEELTAIRERSDSPDVRALLWEIKRLRAIVGRADQLQKSMGDFGGAVGIILTALRNELVGEPCVEELARLNPPPIPPRRPHFPESKE